MLSIESLKFLYYEIRNYNPNHKPMTYIYQFESKFAS